MPIFSDPSLRILKIGIEKNWKNKGWRDGNFTPWLKKTSMIEKNLTVPEKLQILTPMFHTRISSRIFTRISASGNPSKYSSGNLWDIWADIRVKNLSTCWRIFSPYSNIRVGYLGGIFVPWFHVYIFGDISYVRGNGIINVHSHTTL